MTPRKLDDLRHLALPATYLRRGDRTMMLPILSRGEFYFASLTSDVTKRPRIRSENCVRGISSYRENQAGRLSATSSRSGRDQQSRDGDDQQQDEFRVCIFHVLRCVRVGGFSCPNQSGVRVAGQRLLRNNRSLSRYSVNASSFARAGSSRRSGFPSASDARNATPISSSKASASLTRARPSRSMRKSSTLRFADACQPAPGSRAWGNCGYTTFAFGHRVPLRENASAIHSGDGLGNHQPGSMTWGGLLRETPAPSGRAHDRAICPAVARSYLWSAA
jgi:hypothetical protein